ncbi:uncharacterized protein LOC143290881 [Babylonia areolata]|uniref:uncharacterized protein LOC143290881 n=1 Tax=Babylonia areolata TaxID=304850 RepID=UPI003FD00949
MEGQEMERDAVPPKDLRKTPLPREVHLEMPSLAERLQDNFEFRAPNKFLADLVARLAVPMYFFTITATWYLGMFEVMPLFFPDAEDPALLYRRVLMVVIYLEMMLNWLSIRFVDSSYLAYLKRRWLGKRRVPRGGGGGGVGPGGEGSLQELLENGSAFRNQNGVSGRGINRDDFQHENSGTLAADSRAPWKPAFKPPQQTVYPYWSWVPCYVCEVMRPPRCHHCPVCQTCVLKRDHHCFFAGSCVGWRNQRHFLIFVTWALLGCSYASYNGFVYFLSQLWPWMTWFDLLAPVTLIRWALGYVSGMVCLCVWVQTLLIYFILLSFSFANEHVQLILKGLTSFEVTGLKKTVELRDSRKLGAKFRSVLGRWWLLSFLFPLHWLWDAEEDPENWPSIKVYRH